MLYDVVMKVSPAFGVDARGAELHTVELLCDQFVKLGISFCITGCDSYHGRHANVTYCSTRRYSVLPRPLKIFCHVPFSLLNLLNFLAMQKRQNNLPKVLMCTGGVYYNGVAIVVCGKLFDIQSVVRTAEDHYWIGNWNTKYTLSVAKRLVLKVLSIWALKRADHVLTTGKNAADYFTHKLNRSVTGIPGPADITFFESFKTSRTSARSANKRVKLVYVGSLSPEKGAIRLLELFRLLVKNEITCDLQIIGPEPHAVKKYFVPSGAVNVIPFGKLSHKEMAQVFSHSDCLLFFTQLRVGYGQVNIEAAAANLPVLFYKPSGEVLSIASPRQICLSITEMFGKIKGQDFESIPRRLVDDVIDPDFQNSKYIRKLIEC